MRYYVDKNDAVFAFEDDADPKWYTGLSEIAKEKATRLATSPRDITDRHLCDSIDMAADAARAAVVGDPIRAVEYARAAEEAELFKTAGYPESNVPRTVAAWAINGRTAREAADAILAEAAAYNEVLYVLREMRLLGKERVREAIAQGDAVSAQSIATDTIIQMQQAAAGVGNA